jgi:hypothetical protein
VGHTCNGWLWIRPHVMTKTSMISLGGRAGRTFGNKLFYMKSNNLLVLYKGASGASGMAETLWFRRAMCVRLRPNASLLPPRNLW